MSKTKRCLLDLIYRYVGLLILVSVPTLSIAETINIHPAEQTADQQISQLYHELDPKLKADVKRKLSIFSSKFIGTPYLLFALGEGMGGDYDKAPIYRFDVFDCETFVDTILALAFAKDLASFQHYIKHIRYHDGHVSLIERNHFTCIDWNKNNQKQGFIKDITSLIHDEHHLPIFKQARALINKKAWYQHYSIKRLNLPGISDIEKEKRLVELKACTNNLANEVSIIPYLPLNLLFNDQGIANLFIFKQIPNGSIIEIIRPHWDLTKQIGTQMNVSHLGFGFWKNGVLYFRQASSQAGLVEDTPLISYLRQALKSPTIQGINIQQVNDTLL